YPAYVSTPPAGGPTVFRVRVGQFRDRAEAQSMASRLETQERFKPWITH
ncbi:MAG: SPOR domain-containing protein, partial [Acidobacteria bacterium]|nr:SPOR domain-containing protein [Acidobacteriota bacterium]